MKLEKIVLERKICTTEYSYIFQCLRPFNSLAFELIFDSKNAVHSLNRPVDFENFKFSLEFCETVVDNSNCYVGNLYYCELVSIGGKPTSYLEIFRKDPIFWNVQLNKNDLIREWNAITRDGMQKMKQSLTEEKVCSLLCDPYFLTSGDFSIFDDYEDDTPISYEQLKSYSHTAELDFNTLFPRKNYEPYHLVRSGYVLRPSESRLRADMKNAVFERHSARESMSRLTKFGLWDIVLKTRISSGGYGAIYEGVEIRSGTPRTYAIKMYHPNQMTEASRKREVQFFERMAQFNEHHTNIIDCHGLITEPNETILGIVLELMDRDLKTESQTMAMSDEKAVYYCLEIARGLSHLHNNGYVHRDIKPENVLLKVGDGLPIVKLCDFGCVARMDELVGFDGTVEFCAPETFLLADQYYAPSSDMFALGWTIFEMLTTNNSSFDEFRNSIQCQPTIRPDLLAFDAKLQTIIESILDFIEVFIFPPRLLVCLLSLYDKVWLIRKSIAIQTLARNEIDFNVKNCEQLRHIMRMSKLCLERIIDSTDSSSIFQCATPFRTLACELLFCAMERGSKPEQRPVQFENFEYCLDYCEHVYDDVNAHVGFLYYCDLLKINGTETTYLEEFRRNTNSENVQLDREDLQKEWDNICTNGMHRLKDELKKNKMRSLRETGEKSGTNRSGEEMSKRICAPHLFATRLELCRPELIRELHGLIVSETQHEKDVRELQRMEESVFAQAWIPIPDQTSLKNIIWKTRKSFGAVANVFACELSGHDGEFAFKIFHTKQLKSTGVHREVDFYRYRMENKLRNRNILDCFSIVRDPKETVGLLLELMDADLSSVCKNRSIECSDILNYCLQVAEGLQYLHKLEFVHRDIKPENILFKDVGGEQIVKICDFGCIIGTDEKTGYEGTPMFSAPEIIDAEDDQYLLKTSTDMFSLGWTIHETLNTTLNLQSNEMPTLTTHHTHHTELQNLVTRLRSHCPEDRPSATECCWKLREMIQAV